MGEDWVVSKQFLAMSKSMVHGYEFEVMMIYCYMKTSLADFNSNALMRCTLNLIIVQTSDPS